MREAYPMVVVHRSEPLAVLVPGERALCVYRDGTPIK
jgi:hypothetical protein